MKTISALLATLLVFLISTSPLSATKQGTLQWPTLEKDIVILLHGLGRSTFAMGSLASKLEDAGFDVVRIGYRSLSQTPEQILEHVSEQINECCVERSRTVHFVGHSLGGLVARAYLQREQFQNLGHVVLMGTPNQGSELVDRFYNRWWIKILGPTARSLGTGPTSFPNSLKPPYYSVGVIAGISEGILNDKYLPGEDDGLVTVEATKLKGMSDFVIVETGHSAMRHNNEVAKQAISFMRYGKFLLPTATIVNTPAAPALGSPGS